MRFLRWIAGSGLRVTLAIALAFATYHVLNELRVLSGAPLNFLQRLELTALDVKFAFRGPKKPDWGVGIAGLDEKAIDRFGPPPWPRTVHAQLVDRLTELGAASIAYDMTFEQATSSGKRALVDEVQKMASEVGLPAAKTGLERSAQAIDKTTKSLQKLKRPPQLAKLAADLEPAEKEVRGAVDSLNRFDKKLELAAAEIDPDNAFAAAIARSGRVVLGVVALSRNEAESIESSAEQLAAAYRLVRSSTITEMVEPDSAGTAHVFDARAVIRDGAFRRYFGLRAPVNTLAQATAHFATINAAPDDDGVNRRMPLLTTVKGSGVLLPSLALKAVEVAKDPDLIEVLGAPGDPAPHAIRIGALVVPTELEATTTIDWYGRFDQQEIPLYSIADLIDGKVPSDEVRGKVIFVAATAIGTHDQRVTPLERAVPGVYIHATLAQNLLDGRHLARPTYAVGIEVLILMMIGLLSGLVMTRFHVVGQVVIAVALAVGWVALDQFVLFQEGLVVYSVLPTLQVFITLLAVAIWGFLVEQRERRRTKQAFGQYLSPKVMEQVLSDPEEYLKLGGRRYEATVLFSDIRGFTTISEALTPEELGRMLNRYMTPMTKIVFDFEGTLDKYIGDAVMAFWGAPVEQKDHAVLACRAALKMLAIVEELNKEFAQDGLPHIAIGVGLSSGPMTIGNMGSDEHFAYTALGDKVNLGSRLEGQTKDYGVDVIISEDTHEKVKEVMLCRELGALRVKGKLEPVRIYELLGPIGEQQGRLPFVEAFHLGLVSFRARSWDDAAAHFTRARALKGVEGDKCCDNYIAWCMEYKEAPPPSGWDGVRTATSK
ncbi:MAG: CHASE2 domain-containing protein [Deltaproteobacteria bacterium]|nr:CHASE2 domain-containing protein [Deltaproteobacteria bacterium]